MTELHVGDGAGGEVVQFRRRTPPEPQDDLELADHQPGTQLVPAERVFDAELVDDEDPQPAPTGVAKVLQPVVVVVRHEKTVTFGKAAARQIAYLGTGAAVIAKRWWDKRTGALYERQIHAAEAKGDQEGVREWETRREQAKERQHRRLADLLELPGKLARALGTTLGILFVLLVLAGLVATYQEASFLEPLFATLEAIAWLAALVAWLAGVLVVLVPALLAAGVWQVGRRHGEIPRWVASPSARIDRDDVPITPSIVVTALRDLGISELRKAILKMGDAGAAMLGPITLAGCGVEVDVHLPSGVTTEEVQRKRRKLAENLGRHEHELFITIPQAARTVRLWIADPGALDEPIGPSPLVMDEDMTADLFTGQAPWGQDLRGDRAALSLLMRHLLITGLSNQGKTAALRALVLWLALDPTVELRVADLKGVGDWRMFGQLATTLIQGPTDEHVIAATEMLEDGVREMERRIAALEASGATDGVTPKMARSGHGFHPLFLIVDEAQVAFMCPAKDEAGAPYGGTKASSRYFMAARKLHNQGRAVLVHLWQGTQDPTDQNLPKLVREGAHIRAALVLGTEEQARMALGDKAVNGGAAPHKLRQGLDKGTLVVAGDGAPLPPGQASITIRTHFINGESAAEVAERAAERRGAVRVRATEEVRDLLTDVAEVLRGVSDPVRVADVVRMLRTHFPRHRPYQDTNGLKLAARLTAEGVDVPKTRNVYPVYPERVRAALAARSA